MIKKKIYLSITSCLFLLVTAITVTYAWYVTIQKDAFESPNITGYSTAAYFAGGDGTENNPYKLTNSRHVYNLAWLQYLGTFNDTVRETDDVTTEEDETKYLQTVYFKVENDIDCSTTTGNLILPPIGTSKYPFIGNFDGGGHTISNVTVTNTFSEIKTKPTSVSELKDCSVVGLFGIIGNYEGMELPDGISVLSRVVINENGSKTIKPINAVNNLYLNNTKVKASSSEALIGIFAGYVNATIYNIGVHYADISLSTGVSKLSTSNAISNYAIIGDYNDEKTGVQWEERPGGSTGYGTSTNIKDLYDKHAATGIDTDVAYPFTQGAGNIGYYVGPGITFAAMNRTTKETDAGVTTAGIDTSSLYTHGSQSSVFTVDYNESLKNVYDGTINSPTSATGYDTYFLKVNNSYDSNNKIRNLSGYVGDTYYDGNLNLPKGGVWIAAQQTGLFQFVLVTADIDGNNQSDGGSFALYQIDRNTPGDYSTDFSATQIAMSNNSMAYATGSQIYIDNVAYNTYHETGFAFYFEYEATAGDEFFVTKKDGTAAYFWYMDIGAAGGGDEIVPIGTISKVDYVKAAGNVLEKITDQTYVRSDVLFAIDSQSTGSNVVYYFRRNSFVDSDEYPDVVLWFKEYSGDDSTNTTMSVVGDSKKQTEAGDNTCTYIKGTQSAADIVSSTISAYNTLNSAPAEYNDAYYNKIMALSNYSNSFANMTDESLLVGTEWENSDLATQKAVINTLINDALNNYYQAGANNIIALIDAIPTGEITASNYKEYTDEIMAAYNAIDGEGNNNVLSKVTNMSTFEARYAEYLAAIPTFTVTFETNGGSTISSQSIKDGESATKPTTNPTKTNAKFVGWYSDEGLTIEFNFSSAITSNTIIYAKWEDIITREVTFETNGGSTVAAVIIEDGQTVTKPSDPTRTGYYFVGWYSNEELTAEFNFSSAITSDTTIYAKWQEKYTITFVYDDATLGIDMNDTTSTTNIDAKLDSLPSETSGNYVIEGWYLDEAFSNKVTKDTVFTESTTLYAKWQEKPANLTVVKIDICLNNNWYAVVYPEIADGISITDLTSVVISAAAENGTDLSSYTFEGVYNGWLQNKITDDVITIADLSTTGYNGQTVPYICINFTS